MKFFNWFVYTMYFLVGLIWLAGGVGACNIVYCGVGVVCFAVPVLCHFLRKQK